MGTTTLQSSRANTVNMFEGIQRKDVVTVRNVLASFALTLHC